MGARLDVCPTIAGDSRPINNILTIYREYVQNAADAIDEARSAGTLDEGEPGTVQISIDAVRPMVGISIVADVCMDVICIMASLPPTAATYLAIRSAAGGSGCADTTLGNDAVANATTAATMHFGHLFIPHFSRTS